MIARGSSLLPLAVELASPDIRHRLWSLYWLARFTSDVGTVVELGVRAGDSTRALLSACLDNPSLLFSFDIESCEDRVIERAARDGYPLDSTPWWFVRMDSVEAGQRWTHGNIDLLFVDTSHEYEHTKAEIAVWAPHVPAGKVMVFHDYFLRDPPRDGVKRAVDEFVAESGSTLELHEPVGGDTGLAIVWR